VHLFDSSRVAEDLQKSFYEAGVSSVKEFAAMFENTAALRQLLKTEFKLDENDGLAARVRVSKVVVAFESAKARTTKQAEMDGEAEIREQPKRVPLPDFFSMRAAFEERYGTLTDDQVPGKGFMEKRLEMIEKGDFKAEALTDVLSLDDDEADTMKAIFNSSGQLEAVRVGKRVPMPVSTEDLRSRIALLGRSWCMAALLHTHRPYLKDATPAMFDRYVGYLLGRFVLGLVSQGPPGTPVSSPSWAAVLHYDHEVRKQAMRYLLTGSTLGEAFQKSMDDPVVRERSFTTPLALSHLKKGRTEEEGSWGQPGVGKRARKAAAKAAAAQKGKGQGAGQGESKGKGDKGKSKGEKKGGFKGAGKCASKTPEGKPICYAYNSGAGGCQRKPCGFEHVCGVCFKAGHGAYNCPQGPKYQ